jgi:hypothetical protein
MNTDFAIGVIYGALWVLDCVAYHHCRRPLSWWGVLPFGGFYFWIKERM